MTAPASHWCRRARAIGAGLCAAVLLAACALIAAGLLADGPEADVAVVLGNTVAPDGRPSPRLAARLDRAYDCYAAARCRVLFVSGGVDPAGHDEAAVMRDYLIARGVPAGRVVADSLGNDTWATATHAGAYMREHGYASAMAITQYFHVPRTMLALRRHGVQQVGGASPRYAEARDLYSILRELPAIAWYALRPL
ncbi:vancomycin high temperature exclusion protein [Achromobacter ruhlandii]|uniref:SanA/YdcF family protein n=1 Tax=Achromobacter ruhlandii TaxID=72557 RepID=UPI0007BF41FD|nr:YdcF family protein [Achromobacter ruhlandii]